MTFPHCSYSARSSAANSAGVEPTLSTPCFANCSFTCGAPSARTSSLCSRDTTACGVPRGASTPYQPVVLNLSPLSAIVGSSGSSGERLSPAHRERAHPARLDVR